MVEYVSGDFDRPISAEDYFVAEEVPDEVRALEYEPTGTYTTGLTWDQAEFARRLTGGDEGE